MSIKKRVMDYLAKRDHSEKELKLKLSRLKSWEDKKKPRYSTEEIKEVLLWAKQNNWILEGNVLSERWTQSLDRKKKGINYINAFLNQKGLPKVDKNPELELEKAVILAKRKVGAKEFDIDLRMKVRRFLLSRGFDSETISKAIRQLK